ncbi:metallophos domain-containing protein [Trichonephila clavipes]|nr:metallophos domain-containing protein [Trichonephila clavipes]
MLHNSSFEFIPVDKWMANLIVDEAAWFRDVPYVLLIPSIKSYVMHAGFLPGIPIRDNQPYTILNLRTVIAAPECPGG